MLTVIGVGLLSYLAVCAFLYLFQRSLLYFPTAVIDAVDADQVALASGGETVHLWRSAEDCSAAIIYFGGNAEAVALSHASYRRLFPNHTIYLLEYRGYGRSTGSPTEAGLLEDALAVADHVLEQHSDVVVIGRSLGSGLAVQVAASRPVRQLVLITPYDSLLSVAQSIFPWLPVGWLLKDQYRAIDIAPQVAVPTLILAAERDTVIPPHHAERLAGALPSVWRTVVVPDAGHNDISDSRHFDQAIRAFADQRECSAATFTAS